MIKAPVHRPEIPFPSRPAGAYPRRVQAQFEALGLILLASLLAGAVGWERESRDKPAGFRTHMIVGGATALLTLAGPWMVAHFETASPDSNLRPDPLRVVEAIVVGVSFIGAGTIFKGGPGDRVRYLTTAASLLFSAGIGICVAVEHFVVAVGLAVVILVINGLLGRIERRRER